VSKPAFKEFWMVVRKPMKGANNHFGTRVRHYDLDEARAEAQRLANQESVPFLVTRTVERFDAEEVSDGA